MVDSGNLLGRGIAFPPRVGSDGRLAWSEGEANIRDAIRVIDGNASLLQSCATNPSMYFDVQDASQLNSVFSAIAQNLANLRLAK